MSCSSSCQQRLDAAYTGPSSLAMSGAQAFKRDPRKPPFRIPLVFDAFFWRRWAMLGLGSARKQRREPPGPGGEGGPRASHDDTDTLGSLRPAHRGGGTTT